MNRLRALAMRRALLRGGFLLLAVLAASASGLRAQAPTSSPSAPAPLAHHSATWLADGRLLIAGGVTPNRIEDHFTIWSHSRGPLAGVLAVGRASLAAVPLPDGTVLIVGGSDARGALDTLERIDPATGGSSLLPVRLLRAVSDHTATLLPDGRVLIVGGRGADGKATASVQIIDLAHQVVLTSADVPTARAGHAAVLLGDGRVLITGGQGASSVLASSEVWDPVTQVSAMLSDRLSTPRAGHTATLLPSGDVLIIGGLDGAAKALGSAEIFDPLGGTFRRSGTQLTMPRSQHSATFVPSGDVLIWGGVDGAGALLARGELLEPSGTPARVLTDPAGGLGADHTAPTAMATAPSDGASNVSTTAPLVLRFSEPLSGTSVTATTVTLTGPTGGVAINGMSVEAGLLLFVTPRQALQPSSRYTLRVDGATDTAGLALPPTTLTFTTDASGAGGSGTGGSGGSPTSTPGRDDAPADRDDDADKDDTQPSTTRWSSLPPLEAPPGVTALAGQALRVNGYPLRDMTLTIGGHSARTDGTGRFLLYPLDPGRAKMFIDGRTVKRGSRTYGTFEVGVWMTAGRTVPLGYTIWMTPVDTDNAVFIPSPTTTDVVVRTPRIPGLEVHIPAGTVIRDHDGHVVRQISLTQILLEQPPFPLPQGIVVPLYFTIQPGGAYVVNSDWKGVRIYYPNRMQRPPGSEFNFWHYDAEDRGWYIYGQGTVTENGAQVVPNPGVGVYEFTGAMVAPGTTGPSTGPTPDGSEDGEPVDLSTGLFVLKKTDLVIADVLPVKITRSYRPGDTLSRAFGIGTNHAYDIFLTGNMNPYTFIDLFLPDGARIHYDRISPGTDFGNAVYQHTATPTMFYGSKISWSGTMAGWDLRFRDGTLYQFPEASLATRSQQAALVGLRDRYGNTMTFERDSASNLTKITSPNGRWVVLKYDSANRITSATDNIGRTVTYTYDGSGRLATVTNPISGVTEYTYDTSHRMLTQKDARGIVFLTNEYDSSGRVTRQTQADGTTYQFAYTVDGSGKIIQADVTNPRGHVRRVTLNAAGYALTDTSAVGLPEEQGETYVRQTGTNLVQSKTDALGRRTDYTYDTIGNPTSITRLAGTPNATTSTFTYEPCFFDTPSGFCRVQSTTPSTAVPDGRVTFSYVGLTQTTATDARGAQTTTTYNSAGQVLTVRDALMNTIRWEYDSQGNVAATVDPLLNRTAWSYDAVGRAVTHTDPRGRTTAFVYDALNRRGAVSDAAGGTTRFTYDANGNLLTVTDARGGVTSYTYNNMDRLTTRTDSLGRPETYVHDANGNLIQFTDRKSQVRTFSYDALNRRTAANYAGDGSSTTFSYDAGNRRIQLADSVGGTITRGYDLLDRLTSAATSLGTISYQYDVLGRRTQMSVPGQASVLYSYDVASRLTQMLQGTQTVTFEYDDANRRTRLVLPNGVATEYQYDAASRLTGLTYKTGSTISGALSYAFDPASNRNQQAGSWARTTLPQGVASATYNAASQQLTFGSQTLSYDLNGNLISDGTTMYAWDARNRLVGLTAPDMVGSFQYDAVGRRIAKTLNGTTTTVLHDGVNPTQEATGAIVRNLLTGLGVDDSLSYASGSGETRLSLTDALGSTIALTDASGAVVTEYTYEPFGSTTGAGAPSENRAQYTGRDNDGTGLYYYRARYYSPSRQRFISEDPVGFGGRDVNLYAYARNAPVQFVDPLGLYVVEYTDPDLECMKLGGRKDECDSGPGDRPLPPMYACVMGCAGDVWVLYMLGALAVGAIIAQQSSQGAPPVDWEDLFSFNRGAKDPSVADVLKGKKGSIKQAPLPPGSPSWDDILDRTMADIEKGAKENRPGYKEIRKLLQDKRFDK